MRGRVFVLVVVLSMLFVLSAWSAEWVNYSERCNVRHLAAQGNRVWVGTVDGNGAAWVDSTGTVAFYIPSDGLADGNITALACDDLSVWFGTNMGITMFNGEQFETYNRDNSGLLTNYIDAIAVDPRTLDKYIGTETGVSVYDGVNWRSYTPYNSDLASPYVSTLFVDADTDELFVGTDLGVSVLNITDETWHQYKIEHGLIANRVSSIAKDLNGDYWFATYQGASRFDGTNWYSYTYANGRLSSDHVNDIAVSPDGHVWLSTDNGLNRINGAETVVYDVASYGDVGLVTDWGYDLVFDADGNLWIATSRGVMVFDGENFETHLGAGLRSNFITCVEPEGRTTYWFGTDDSGVNRLNDTGIYGWYGLVSDAISDISSHLEAGRWYDWFGGAGGTTIYDGTNWWNPGLVAVPYRIEVEYVDSEADNQKFHKWICTQGQGVFERSGIYGNFTENTYTVANSDLLSDTVNSVTIDEDHTKWFGTDMGVSILGSDGSWNSITMLEGLPSNHVTAVDFKDDEVWYGTDMGVAVQKGDEWTTYQHIGADGPFIQDDFSTMEVETWAGNCVLWFGGSGGLLSYDGGDWTIYKEANSALLSNDVRDIAIDAARTKWICTSEGIASIDSNGNFWVTQSTIIGLLSNDVRSVLVDETDNKWFATGGGVSMFDGTSWTNYTIGSLPQGLCSNDVRALAVDAVDRVWVGTANGLCVIDAGEVTLAYNIGNSDIASNSISSIVIDRNGIKWIGTDAGVCKFNGLTWRTYDTNSAHLGLPSNNILDLYIDPEFNIWASTSLGVAKYDYAEWQVFGAEFGPLGYEVRFASVGCLDDVFWFGTEYGIVKYEMGDWDLYSAIGLGSNVVNDLKVDAAGKVWIATDWGVSVFSNGFWTSYNRTTGGPAHDMVRRVTIDSDDNKWFATAGGGVSLYVENHDPGLSDPELTPKCGQPAAPKLEGTGTEFDYSVYYFDSDVSIASVGYFAEAFVYIDGIPYEMSLSSGTAYNGRYSFSIGDLPEGQHTYYFYFVKESGNIVKLPASGVFSGPAVDGTPPTSIASADESMLPYTQLTTLKVNFTADDPGSGIDSVSLFARTAGDEEWEDTGLQKSKPFGFFEYRAYTSATYEFCAIATNNAGLTEELPEEAECTIIFDRQSPNSRIQLNDYRAYNDPVLRIPFNASDGGSGVDHVELWHMHEEDDLDFGRFPVATIEGSSGLFIYTAEKSGWHIFYTIAVDKAGNRESVPPPYLQVHISYDPVPPNSSCSTVEFAGSEFEVNFTARDPESHIKSVDLYYRIDGGVLLHYDTHFYAESGTFNFVAPQDGVYDFYTQAEDFAGNIEQIPSVADATCISDITPPVGQTTCVEATNQRSITVAYDLRDETSGVKEVTLWVKFGNGSWLKTSHYSEYRQGEFTFRFQQGEGQYYLAAVGEDNSGAKTPLDGESGAPVYYETVPPKSLSWCEPSSDLIPFTVEFSATDEGYGLDTILLFYRHETQLGWIESDDLYLGTPAGGFFSFYPIEGGGNYEFYTLAIDKAGNMELPPLFADCAAVIDLSAPESEAIAPSATRLAPILVDFTAEDDASGVMSVELWYAYQGEKYQRFNTLWGIEQATFSFTPDDGAGIYSFYTIATDRTGKREAIPHEPDSMTEYNPGGPSLTLYEDEHDFGMVAVNGSKSWSLRLLNTGDSQVMVSSVGTSAGVFDADFRNSTSIEPGDYIDVAITFAPESVGVFTDSVLVVSDDPYASELSAALSGEGVDEFPPTIGLTSTASNVTKDQRLIVSGRLSNSGSEKAIDVYVAVKVPNSEMLCFYPNWNFEPMPISLTLPADSELGPVSILDLFINEDIGRGEYTIYGAVVAPGTQYDVLSEISTLSIIIE
ncbi:MAG: DUF1573 domain-containing protein [Candidatus Coatesbacteria bacterium]|nr:DUF1573 domain-containing protein [Candidatus Coatesbacteria bacterium]